MRWSSRLRALSAEPDNVSSMLETHMVEGEPWFPQNVSSCLHMLATAGALSP